MTTEHARANARFPDQAELNRRLAAAERRPVSRRTRLLWLALEILAFACAAAAGGMLLAGLFGVADRLLG